IVAPEVTAPEGYEFTGWYTDADCTEAFDLETKFRSDVIREVETLYAGYAPIAAEEIEDAE
ncbi:MAG: InlB B-repeat-containing protein, partial [Clostridia bacterium]|nr:InlB B-repeat-containing protein [Clostridia bacterium]